MKALQMNHLFPLIAILIGASPILEAQPRITAIGNAADYSTPLAPGSLATIIGTGLAASAAQPGALPFPVSFNNVSVSVNGRTAPLTYISPAQINFQIPYSTVVGSATLSVSFSGQSSNIFRFPVVASAPGIFQYGENRAVAQNQDYSVNSTDNPANGGASIVVYLTGIGLTNPVVADGLPRRSRQRQS